VALDDVKGQIVDLDSHLMLFPSTVKEILGPGPGGRPWGGRAGGPSVLEEIEHMITEEGVEVSGEGEALAARREMARSDVWGVRLWGAHGAQLAEDRIDALDQMGIDRQLVLSQFMEPVLNTEEPEGFAAARRYNDYVLDWGQGYPRLAPVCILNTSNVDEALAEARRVVDRGAVAVHLAGRLPPGGLAPSAPEWDPLWATLSEAGVAAVLHYGPSGGGAPLLSDAWYVAAWRVLGPPPNDPDYDDFHAQPFVWMTAHLYAEITLTFMVLGGVFDRFPGLRFGVIESGASWVASWCQRMDVLAETTSKHLSRRLSLKPSDYVRRQVRVTPFPFEPVATWIEQTGFEEVYAFATDFPHEEGGVDTLDRFYRSLAPLGGSVVDDFFVRNGSFLLAG